MLKTISLITIGLLACISVAACDICGCSVSGTYMGILPRYSNHFIGLRYQYRSFESRHPVLHPDETPLLSEERYQTAELWGRYVLSSRWHLFAFVPMHWYQKSESGIISRNEGLGDVQLLANYLLFNTTEGSGRWRHALQMGGGIKLPTGKSQNRAGLEEENPKLLPGTGSYDLVFNALYNLRRGDWGLNTDLNYRYNTANRVDYRFGDKMSAGIRAFYWKSMSSATLLPSAGFQWEYSKADTRKFNHTEVQDYTGGGLGLLSGGLDVFFQGWSLGVQVQQPVVQQLGEGQIKARTRLYAQVNFLF